MSMRRKTVKTETAQKALPTNPAAAGTPDAQAAERFLRLMSHEMRTPLNGVIGMLGLLARTRMDGAQRAYVSAARDSAEHLLGLVNDLLDYARVDAGHLELDSEPVNLEALVQGVAELLSPRAHDKGLSLVWTVAPDAPDVLADEGRLRQILFNLAGNAVKFTGTGGVRIAIERAGGRDSRPKLAFIIDDTGPACRPRRANASSRNSATWTPPTRRASTARGWVWRWSASWPRPWTARSASPTGPAAARASVSRPSSPQPPAPPKGGPRP